MHLRFDSKGRPDSAPLVMPANILVLESLYRCPLTPMLKAGLASALLPGLKLVVRPLIVFTAMLAIQYPGRRGDVYNILWILVFGFATLNILGLVARRFEPDRTRLNFGELLAVLVVVLSVGLLVWEFLGILHIFPIQLRPR